MNENQIIDKENAIRFAQAVEMLYASFKVLNTVAMSMEPENNSNTNVTDHSDDSPADKDV